MAAFLCGVAVLAVMAWHRLADIFLVNPFFNCIILTVLVAGVVGNIRQVVLLAGEVEWIDGFRSSKLDCAPGAQPRLLAPMAHMLTGRRHGMATLSAPSLRTILDSVQLRLEESRDLSRYLIGLAIFLGLLGTFWGLLVTIRSISDIIGTLGVGNDAVMMFAAFKENLKEPLSGMSTSFSTSLFGLSSSLVIGFLDLQASRAQNRFYNELEEWLSGMTHLSSGSAMEGDRPVPAYVQALLEQTADGLDRMQRVIADDEREHRFGSEQFGELLVQLGRLNDLMSRDLREREASASAHDELKTVLRQIASHLPSESRLSDELRAELRLLSRTIAAASDQHRSHEPTS